MRLLKEVRNLMGSYHVKSGIYHFYRNEFKQAVDFFTKALKDEPTVNESDRRTARYFLTQTFIHSAEKLAAVRRPRRRGARLRARERGEPGVSRHPVQPGSRPTRRMGRVDEAIEQYRLAIASNADYDHARTRAGLLPPARGTRRRGGRGVRRGAGAAHASPVRALRHRRCSASARG